MNLTIARGAMTAITLGILAIALPQNSDAAELPQAMVGAGVAYTPEYAGAEKRRLVPVLVGEYNFGNGAFISTMRGIGYATTLEGVELSGALGYRAGRDDSRHKNGVRQGSDYLKGMGDIDGSATANLGAGMRFGDLGVGVGAQIALSKRDNGNTYSLNASYPLYKSLNDQVELSGAAVYGDAKHGQTYFGVTAAQSLKSGFKATKVGSGFEQVSASVAWNHVIDKSWSVRSAIGLTTLVGDAADSPLTQKKTTPMLVSTINYRF
jgi:outer membrane protein